jgi:hypothetical protein
MTRDRDRGQTTLDFAIGTSVFLLTVIFVIAYAPTLFDPFAGGTGGNLLVADRAATSLSGDFLAASTAEPGALSVACVGAFFDVGLTDNVSEANCDGTDLAAFDDPEGLDELLSLDGRSVDVTIHELDAPVSTPAEPAWAEGSLTRSNDDSVPSDVAVATRTVSIEGTQYRLTVQVW